MHSSRYDGCVARQHSQTGSRIVYSTREQTQPAAELPTAAAFTGKQSLVVKLDRKKRNGKTVTLICGYSGTTEALASLARELKTVCGVGGSVKEQTILIQGDHRQRVLTYLREHGYEAREMGS
jgi:translation initiation factor 1